MITHLKFKQTCPYCNAIEILGAGNYFDMPRDSDIYYTCSSCHRRAIVQIPAGELKGIVVCLTKKIGR